MWLSVFFGAKLYPHATVSHVYLPSPTYGTFLLDTNASEPPSPPQAQHPENWSLVCISLLICPVSIYQVVTWGNHLVCSLGLLASLTRSTFGQVIFLCTGNLLISVPCLKVKYLPISFGIKVQILWHSIEGPLWPAPPRLFLASLAHNMWQFSEPL